MKSRNDSRPLYLIHWDIIMTGLTFNDGAAGERSDNRSSFKNPLVIALFLIGCIAAGSMFMWRQYVISIPQVKFNSNRWVASGASVSDNSGRPTARQAMIRDLITNVLPGLSRSEIENKLGKYITHRDWEIPDSKRNPKRHYLEELE